MRAWWGALSLRARLALAFAAMAAGALIFLLAIVARTLGAAALAEGKILPAAAFALGVFFLGGWFVAEWCLREIGKLAAKAKSPTALADLRTLTFGDSAAGAIPAELEGLAALLRHEAARHDRLLGELQRFTADAAHELRTPLTALRTTGEVTLSGHADEAALRETISTMLEEAGAMSALLDRLLRLARLEAKAVEPRTLALAEHLASWREQVLVLAEEKQVAIELDCPSAAGSPSGRGGRGGPSDAGRRGALTVFTDSALLGHAVTNLLHNAIQHSPPNSRITLTVRRHAPATGVGAGRISIAISDQGPGIRPEDQARVFERFYRIDKSRTRESGPRAGGHGLGLCIAKTAVERLGGTLTLRSTVGAGATFTVTLPQT